MGQFEVAPAFRRLSCGHHAHTFQSLAQKKARWQFHNNVISNCSLPGVMCHCSTEGIQIAALLCRSLKIR